MISLGQKPTSQSTPGQSVAHFGSPSAPGSKPASPPFPRGRNPLLRRLGGFPRLVARSQLATREAAQAQGRRHPSIPSLPPLRRLGIPSLPPLGLLIASAHANSEHASTSLCTLGFRVSSSLLFLVDPGAAAATSTPGCVKLIQCRRRPPTGPHRLNLHCSVTAPAWAPCLVPRSSESFLPPPCPSQV